MRSGLQCGPANEEVRYLTLQELASVKGISAPAMLIVGEVARSIYRKQGDSLSQSLERSERSLQSGPIPALPIPGLIQFVSRQNVVAIGLPRSARDKKLPSGNRRHQRYLVAFFEFVVFSEEANVFIVDINIQEAANIALFVAQVRLEFREAAAERVQKSSQVGAFTFAVVRALQCAAGRRWEWKLSRSLGSSFAGGTRAGELGFKKLFERSQLGRNRLNWYRTYLQERPWS